MLTHPTGLFRGAIFRVFRGAVPSNFYTPYNPLNCTSNWTWGAGRPQVGLCSIFLVYFLIRHRISELPRRIAVKLCQVISLTFKIGLKIQRDNAYNFAGSGHNLKKLYQVMWLLAGVITWTLILEGVPPTKFGSAKTSNIWRDFWQLSTLIANISRMDRRNEDLKTALSTTYPPLLDARNLLNFGPQTKKLLASTLTNLSGLFQSTWVDLH